ncbi:MAG: pyridoxamine 5'-phosphate oxidase family protein [Lachnospiraceae bacterium]|nr:pyridoxamine 5'-phosphate oxidase family protein [Lachnospiraceae bacterium]MDE6232174.1 pyridoxamine 5'-phosphate oxidase family protein [Lachnospiraceae bacterium]MDE6254414.1 pyridoxamine 5'-phosphate oxidase family protein [Lachnospiraceae bacterium]
MRKEELFQIMNENPVFHLATMDGEQPRVRGMLLYSADEQGIIFHTASTKDVYRQIKENPKVELCFQGQGIQIRVSGTLENVEDENLKNEIFNHPTRKFLQAWKEQGIDGLLQIFRLKNGAAVTWTMETNFDEKKPIQL